MHMHEAVSVHSRVPQLTCAMPWQKYKLKRIPMYSDVHSEGLTALVACQLLPLNKNPGVRPIDICEIPQRIMAKAILKSIGDDIQSAAGPLQACPGHAAGCEAAIHVMKEIYTYDDTEAVLLVDATMLLTSSNARQPYTIFRWFVLPYIYSA